MMKLLTYLFVGFLSTLGYIYLYCKLSKVNFKLKISTILVFIIGVICVTLLKYYDLKIIGSFAYFIFYPILFYTLDYSSLKKLFYYVFIVWICGILLDLSSMLILLILYYVFSIDIYSGIYVIIPSVYVLILLVILGNTKWLLKCTDVFYKLLNKIRYADFILIVFAIFVFSFGFALMINIRHLSIGLLISMIIFLVIFIFSLLLRAKYNEIEDSIFVDTLRKNNDFYVSMDKEQDIFKHNLISKLLSIESVSDRKSRILIKDLINEFNSNIDYSKKIRNIPYGLDGIINEKIYPYNEKLDIKVDNKIKIDIFDVLRPRRYNVLIEKLSIILDNAVEACINSSNKILIINLYEKNNQIIIEVKNSFSGNMNIDDIGKINYSSKGKKRGLGLYSAFRNNEAGLEVRVVNNMFVAKITAIENINV